MPSSVFDSILLRDSWGTQEMRDIFSDENRVQKWYDVEAALAIEQAELGIIPHEAGADIARHARVGEVDLEAISKAMASAQHQLVPSLRALQERCDPRYGEYLHFGPTTQDIIDTGTMLQLKQAHAVYLRDVKSIIRALYLLAGRHRATAMAGRTHGIQALPITFGHKCAIWLREFARHHERLTQAAPRVFVGSLVGAVGTMASFGPRAIELEARVMKRLGLRSADISWQPARDRVAEYASVLGFISGTLTKIASEVFNLQRTELNEVEEPFSKGKIGSSTMPHKRNPSTCELMITVGRTLKYNVAALQEAMVQIHERESAVWKMEWKALPELCIGLGLLLSLGIHVIADLNVHADRMRSNLDLLGGLLLSERVMFFLAKEFGKQTAHELVYEASMAAHEHGASLSEMLVKNPKLKHIADNADFRATLDPTTYVGLAPELVDRALALTKAENLFD